MIFLLIGHFNITKQCCSDYVKNKLQVKLCLTKYTRHIERQRNISNKACMRFFGLRPLNDGSGLHDILRLKVLNDVKEFVNVGYFYGNLCNPNPRTKYLFFNNHKKNLSKMRGWNFLCNSSCVEGQCVQVMYEIFVLSFQIIY